ncbi:DNA-methyltransferase [Alistipes communis]|uniref:DNA-methyltransferase n=1 Tax=Alistipes communis TaxID=2585118 RepID=UPI001143F3EA|nr:site-specific DNA-methyltransferase [Alistipes communis]BBL15805.1 methyltransferase [Alistipes communis]
MNPNYEHRRPCDGCDLYRGDALEVLPRLAAQGLTADMIFADPPYGTTHCRWDAVIDIPKMWKELKGVSLPRTPVLLFCQQPFTSVLGSSNLKRLRYSWVWEKTQPTGFLNARRMPMKAHEDILVFYDRLPKYNPMKTSGHKRKVVMAVHQLKCEQGEIYRRHDNYRDYVSTERYPRSVLTYKTDKQLSCLHAAQKPVALLEYLIRTYTDEGDTVLDFAMGSGSTGVACRNTGRRFVGIEIDEAIFQTAYNRIANG